MALSFSPNDPKQMIVATMQQGIFTSQDAGETWSAENSGLPAGMTISGLTYDSGGNQVWAATSQGVYRLDRVQRTWTALNTGLPAGLAINCVQLASSQQGLIYAGAQRGFYRSTDAGQHWVSSKDSLAGTSVWSLLESDTVSLYAGTNVGVLQSRDGGETWSGFAHGLPMKEPVYALASGADANNQLFAAANNVYRYPGTSGDLTLSRLLPILLIVGFFVLLSLLIGRKRRRPVQLKKAPDEVK
ncbi:hypothetical protein KTT_30030 [Tengunoibacter tsumagoiensis]|uniref:DUF6242 domain-containing protein n=2 Tax=Tengunoibacter tsumagoiensis TaxID=2014871 RepID=A0A402A1Z9_9CHLR|nr:hypothetical protein KTT_30030 [Tengunoibacter tsumagoiensis]